MAHRTIEFGGERIHIIGPMDGLLKALAAASRMTRRPERMTLIVGEPGCGKTVGARIYAAAHPDDTVLIEIPPASVMRPGRLLQLMETALDLPVCGGRTLYDRLLAICEEMRQHSRLLIFDEANRIRQSNYLDLLRFVHDVAGARMAFISLPSLQYVFELHPEFGTRLQLRYQMKALSAPEVAAMLPGFPAETVEAIHAQSGGRPRSVMVLAELLREVERKEQTADTVRRIARRFTLARAVA